MMMRTNIILDWTVTGKKHADECTDARQSNRMHSFQRGHSKIFLVCNGRTGHRQTDRQTWYDQSKFLDFEDMISSQETEKTEQEGGSYDELPEETSMEQDEVSIHDELSADHGSSDVMDMDGE